MKQRTDQMAGWEMSWFR